MHRTQAIVHLSLRFSVPPISLFLLLFYLYSVFHLLPFTHRNTLFWIFILHQFQVDQHLIQLLFQLDIKILSPSRKWKVIPPDCCRLFHRFQIPPVSCSFLIKPHFWLVAITVHAGVILTLISPSVCGQEHSRAFPWEEPQPQLQEGKWRLSVCMSYNEWQGWDSNSGHQIPEPMCLTLRYRLWATRLEMAG